MNNRRPSPHHPATFSHAHVPARTGFCRLWSQTMGRQEYCPALVRINPRMAELKSLGDGEFCDEPHQDGFLVILGRSPDVSGQNVEVRFGWPCILETFITIGALGHQIGRSVLAPFGFMHPTLPRACRHWLKFRGGGHSSLKFPVFRPAERNLLFAGGFIGGNGSSICHLSSICQFAASHLRR